MERKFKVRSIKENAILNIIFTTVNIIAPMITFPYISRVLLPETLGKVDFFSSLSTYGVMFASFGLTRYGIRYVSRIRDDKKELSKVTLELIKINIITSIIVVSLLLISSLFITKFKDNFYLLIINLLIVLFSCIELDWFYSGLEQYAYITTQSIIFRVLSIICIFLFVKDKSDYLIYSTILASSTVLRSIVNYLYAHKYIDFKVEEKLEIKRHLKPMLILFISTLAIHVYTGLDTLMLGFISGDTQTGLYSAAVKVKTILIAVINAVSSVLYPRLTYYLTNNQEEEYSNVLKKSLGLIILISLPIMCFFIINAKDSILILSGENYLEAVPCMQILMPVLLLSSFSNITGSQILIPHGKDKCYMYAVLTGSIVDLIFNFILMPKYGCTGAAIATLIAELVQAIIQIYFAKDILLKNINVKSMINAIIGVSVASIIMLVLLPLFINLNIIIRFILIGIIFVITYFLILFVLKDKMIKEILQEVVKLNK